MRRPSFGVVTAVVTMLAIFGFVAHFLQGLVIKGRANNLASAPEQFLAQAAEEPIDWQRLDEHTFALALNRNKPILLMIGSGDSYLGRQFDKLVLTNVDVIGLLRRSFVCARIDSDALPRWQNAFLPLTRARGDYLADVNVLALSPQGKLLGTFMPAAPNVSIDYRTFISFLNSADIGATRSAGGTDAQADEVAALFQGSGGALPDFGSEVSALVQFDNPNGGFPNGTRQHLMPLAWRYLLLQGRLDAFRASVDPVLISPAVNWIDGGFFRSSRSSDWIQVDFDESSEVDLEMMWTLALADAALRDPFYRWLAERTFDRLIDNFGPAGWISGWQQGDEGAEDRSARYSFPPRQVRNLFPDEKERDWLQDSLEMRVAVNPLMTPQLKTKEVWLKEGEHLERVLAVLRNSHAKPGTFGADGIPEVNGLAAARLQACARLWNDKTRLAKATDLALRLDTFLTTDDISGSASTGFRSKGTLPDYLAFADACLETFLATGRLDRFREGGRVLRRALFLFAGSEPGVFVLDSSAKPVPANSNPPELLDHFRESCTAWAIRLALSYGELEGASGKDLTSAAYAATSHFSGLANGLGPYVAGYFGSAARLSRAEIAVCVGARADTLAQALYERSPSRIVAIQGGEVRPDLAHRPAGIYIVRGAEVLGPYTLEQAARLLPMAFPYDAPFPQ